MSDYKDEQDKINKINEFNITAEETVGTDFTEVSIKESNNKKIKWLILISAASIIVIVAILFSIFSPTVVNTIARVTLSPAKYYQKIEKENLGTQIDKFSSHYGNYRSFYQNSIDKGINTNIVINATLDSSITTNLGLNGLNNITLNFLSSQIGLQAKSTVAISCNDKDITSMNYYIDMDQEDFYIQVPELNKGFLKASLSDSINETNASFTTKDIYKVLDENPLTEELLNNLFKKYTQLAINEIENVTISNRKTITVNEITSEYTMLTVNIDEKTYLSIAENILTTAKSDKDLLDLLTKTKIYTIEDYNSIIETALDEINKKIENINKNNDLIMKVWIDSKGIITGRDFSFTYDNEPQSLGYMTARNGSKLGIEAWIKSNDAEIINAKGTLLLNLKGANGNISLSYNNPSIGTPQVYNIAMEDVKNVYEDDMFYLNGKYTITNETLSAINAKVILTGKDKQQDFAMEIAQGGVNLANVSILTKYMPYTSFELPKETDTIYDANTQINEFLSTSDTEKYLTDINEKIDIEAVNSIIDGILYSYSY